MKTDALYKVLRNHRGRCVDAMTYAEAVSELAELERRVACIDDPEQETVLSACCERMHRAMNEGVIVGNDYVRDCSPWISNHNGSLKCRVDFCPFCGKLLR